MSQICYAGTVDLYHRLKARDAVDAIYCLLIIGVLNSTMRAYDEAGWLRRQKEQVQLAYERTGFLMDLLTARENRLALLEDRGARKAAVEKLERRYGLVAPPSSEEA